MRCCKLLSNLFPTDSKRHLLFDKLIIIVFEILFLIENKYKVYYNKI